MKPVCHAVHNHRPHSFIV